MSWTVEQSQEFKENAQYEMARIELTMDINKFKKGITQLVTIMKTAPVSQRKDLMEEFEVLKQELTYKYAMLNAITKKLGLDV